MKIPSTATSLFACASCTHRTLIALATAVSLPHEFPLLPTRSIQQASHSTFASISKGHHRKKLVEAYERVAKGQKLTWNLRRRRSGPSAWEQKSNRAKELNKHHLDKEVLQLDPEASEDAGKSSRDTEGKSRLFVKLRKTTDPLQIANLVLQGLKDGHLDTAHEMARKALKDGIHNVVSWNHLIDHEMENKRPRSAMRIYKDMKERGCKPDSHTYTIVLRGLARNANFNSKNFSIVEQAMTVYDHLRAKGSEVTTLIIHSNALLEACARTKNMEAVWSAAGKLPEAGKGAPDARTYTTILHALYESLGPELEHGDGPVDKAKPEGRDSVASEYIESVIQDSEGLWADIMNRWRGRELELDESLVNAMARIYLRSSEQSNLEKIFTLFDESFSLNPPKAETLSANVSDSSDLMAQEPSSGTGGDETEIRFKKGKVDKLAAKSKFPQDSTGAIEYANPGRKILSTLLSAGVVLRRKKTVDHYWKSLTEPTGNPIVQPDAANYMAYFRCLRQFRSSTETANLITTLSSDKTSIAKSIFGSSGLYSIAISTCRRDIFNRNAFHNACQIMDVMKQHRPIVSVNPKILQAFLELGIGTQSGYQDPQAKTVSRQTRPNLHISAKNLVKALSKLMPYLESKHLDVDSREAITRDAVGACDRIVNHEDKETLNPLVREEIIEFKRILTPMGVKSYVARPPDERSNAEKEKTPINTDRNPEPRKNSPWSRDRAMKAEQRGKRIRSNVSEGKPFQHFPNNDIAISATKGIRTSEQNTRRVGDTMIAGEGESKASNAFDA